MNNNIAPATGNFLLQYLESVQVNVMKIIVVMMMMMSLMMMLIITTLTAAIPAITKMKTYTTTKDNFHQTDVNNSITPITQI